MIVSGEIHPSENTISWASATSSPNPSLTSTSPACRYTIYLSRQLIRMFLLVCRVVLPPRGNNLASEEGEITQSALAISKEYLGAEDLVYIILVK